MPGRFDVLLVRMPAVGDVVRQHNRDREHATGALHVDPAHEPQIGGEVDKDFEPGVPPCQHPVGEHPFDQHQRTRRQCRARVCVEPVGVDRCGIADLQSRYPVLVEVPDAVAGGIYVAVVVAVQHRGRARRRTRQSGCQRRLAGTGTAGHRERDRARGDPIQAGVLLGGDVHRRGAFESGQGRLRQLYSNTCSKVRRPS